MEIKKLKKVKEGLKIIIEENLCKSCDSYFVDSRGVGGEYYKIAKRWSNLAKEYGYLSAEEVNELAKKYNYTEI